MNGTQQLAETLRAEGGLLAAALRIPAHTDADGARGGSSPAASVSSRAGEDPPLAPATDATDAPRDEPLLASVPDGPYALTLAAVREGYLLHYAEGRVVDTPDGDLALLGGDRLYALALAELAALGDLDAVAALADLIAECARAHADDEPARAADAWRAAVAAIGRRA